MPYLSNSDADFREMLEVIGVKSFSELISNIPENIRFKGDLNLPEAESELGILRLMEQRASKHKNYTSFLGGGAYDHHSPALIQSIISRPEFYTSYTPYQPEVSQGNLQAMYEFQSMVCELTQMDVTNASMYEAGSALAEAVLLALSHTRKNKVLIPATINCRYQKVVETYTRNMDIEVIEIPEKDFQLDMAALKDHFDDSVAAVVVQHPNYYGFLEQMDAIVDLRGDKKALLIQVYDPVSLALYKTPGEFGADIAIAEGQALGCPQNYGGPFVGLFSVSEKLIRKIPGRLSGVTVDRDGRRGFVLTLQTREQHIRREKATSNICTNSGLMALTAAIYLATMGKQGLRDVANLCLQKAHYLAERLSDLDGVSLAVDQPYFKEFTLKLPVPAEQVIRKFLDRQIFAGISLKSKGHPNHLLVAVTEKRTREELDEYVEGFREIIS